MDGKLLVMNSKDNVGMVLQDTEVDNQLMMVRDGGEVGNISVISEIDIYHKVALQDIQKEDEIIKYGELIGVASKDIKKGEHVHVNNIRSVKV
ncbi:UxaA family hydrolase [Enterococcus dongliensis]|uniref:UxaA family hydrolase n=1 Tax=Enterococcus dongliensis TaxID=2559925 RepID=UPI00289BED28|nr:UxaA family hydrolase [Enterococcus dongliensis]